MAEQERRPNFSQLIDKADSTGKLIRLAGVILSQCSEFAIKAGAAAYLGQAWVNFEKNGTKFFTRSNVFEGKKRVLFLGRSLPDEMVESAQILYEGDMEEQGFSGLSYVKGKDGVEMVYEEQGTYRSEYIEPDLNENAAPKAKELLKALI